MAVFKDDATEQIYVARRGQVVRFKKDNKETLKFRLKKIGPGEVELQEDVPPNRTKTLKLKDK